MAHLQLERIGTETLSQGYDIGPAITTIGSDPENDIVLNSLEVAEYHAQIVKQDGELYLQSASRRYKVQVNGSWVHSALLKEGDRLGIGDARFRFSMKAPSVRGSETTNPSGHADKVLKELLAFSQELIEIEDLDTLLDRLLSRLVQTTNAAKGFIVLMNEDGSSRREVAKNIHVAQGNGVAAPLSDSIVQKVVSGKEAVVISDALNDREFSASVSVVNLKLCSVMCAPLIARGEFLGIIYLGNDNVVSLFDEGSLQLLKAFSGHASLILRNAILMNELQGSNVELRVRLESMRFGNIIGTCPAMQDIYKKITKVATTDISVLIEGETGTGKELIAHEVHARSNRRAGPFVVINCGAIPENLLESELFGHVRGAFTGAVATKNGKFQEANGGTLFLDEMGEMPIQLQVKLLRAIQERKVSKLGDNRLEPVDIRIVAATNRNLIQEVRAGRFREDLYYRLNVVSLSLPPLRDRGDDIELIAKYFLQRYTAEFNSEAREFSPEARTAIRSHKWNGNIRELENRVKKASVFAEGRFVQVQDLDLESGLVHKILNLADAKEDFQRRYIDKVLRMNDGNRTQTARDLGVDPRTIFRHLEKSREEGVESGSTLGERIDERF